MALLAMSASRVPGAASPDDLARVLPDPIPQNDAAVGAAACIANQIADVAGAGGLAAKLIGRVRELLPTVKDEWVRARCFALECTIADTEGDLGAATRHAKQVVDCFARAGASREAAVHRANLGFHHLTLGDYEGAAHHLREAMREGRRLGVRDAEAVARVNLVATLTLSGHAGEALPMAWRSVEECTGDARLESAAHLDLAQTLLALGRADEALHHLDVILTAGSHAQGRLSVEALATKAECHLAKNELLAALEAAERAMREDATTAGRPSITVTAPYAYARAARALGRTSDAKRVSAEGRAMLLERASRISDEGIRGSYLRVRTHVALLALASELDR